MMTTPTRVLVLQKLKKLFPDENQANTALGLLDQYGIESYEQDRERVQLAILKLGNNDLSRLQEYVLVAKQDYRDVLAWAEYPEEMQTFPPNSDLSPETLRAMRIRDRQQYENWLHTE